MTQKDLEREMRRIDRELSGLRAMAKARVKTDVGLGEATGISASTIRKHACRKELALLRWWDIYMWAKLAGKKWVLVDAKDD